MAASRARERQASRQGGVACISLLEKCHSVIHWGWLCGHAPLFTIAVAVSLTGSQRALPVSWRTRTGEKIDKRKDSFSGRETDALTTGQQC